MPVITAAAIFGVLLVLMLQVAVLWRRSCATAIAGGSRRIRTIGRRVTVFARSSRGRRWSTLAAVTIGALVRLGWVVWATRAPVGFNDGAEYLRTTVDLVHGHLPRFRTGIPSAYWSPGYPFVLAPFVAIARATGTASNAFTASLVNVAAGATSVWLTARVGRRWVGEGAAVVAAWLVALCPALVYWTSTAHTETVFTAMALGALALAGRAADADGTSGALRPWLGVGVLVGAATLVRSPGLALLALPALVAWPRRTGARQIARSTLTVVAGAAVLLVPWTVRNGVQVGVWTPTSTSNAISACVGHHDDARAQFDAPTWRLQFDCYHRSPFDDVRLRDQYLAAGTALPASHRFAGPDEPRWYRSTMADALRWAVTHPAEEARLTAAKLWWTWHDEDRVVEGARNFEEPGWAGSWHRWLGLAADLWLWAVEVLAIAALVTVRAARRALPIWAPILGLTLLILAGVAYPHYRYPVVPLLAILAASFVAPPGSRASPLANRSGARSRAAAGGDSPPNEPMTSEATDAPTEHHA